jgi:hypothetical protein
MATPLQLFLMFGRGTLVKLKTLNSGSLNMLDIGDDYLTLYRLL